MFHGSLVALATPMNDKGNIDYPALDRLLDWHFNAGTNGLVIAGTTGESGTLSLGEKLAMMRYVVKVVHERMPVIGGAHANGTEALVDITQQVMATGVDAALIMTPAYIKPTQKGLIRHYRAIAEQVPIPIILYNVPSRTACDMLPETIARLSDMPNIIGVKEATAKMDRIDRIKELAGPTLDIFSGDDGTALDCMRHGGKGVISVTANVAPKFMADMCKAALDKRFDEAEAIDKKLQPLHRALFLESNPIPTKWALAQLQLISGIIRLPLTELSAEHYDAVREAMAQVK